MQESKFAPASPVYPAPIFGGGTLLAMGGAYVRRTVAGVSGYGCCADLFGSVGSTGGGVGCRIVLEKADAGTGSDRATDSVRVARGGSVLADVQWEGAGRMVADALTLAD